MIGPNCIGVLSVADGYVPVPTYNISYRYTAGSVTLVSHSGGMAVNLFNRAQGRGIGVRALVTLGNEADIDMAEMVDALTDDEKTQVITLFMERIGDGERFLGAARRAHAAGKPIVALKMGDSPIGRRSVESHTGALAGEPEGLLGGAAPGRRRRGEEPRRAAQCLSPAGHDAPAGGAPRRGLHGQRRRIVVLRRPGHAQGSRVAHAERPNRGPAARARPLRGAGQPLRRHRPDHRGPLPTSARSPTRSAATSISTRSPSSRPRGGPTTPISSCRRSSPRPRHRRGPP